MTKPRCLRSVNDGELSSRKTTSDDESDENTVEDAPLPKSFDSSDDSEEDVPFATLLKQSRAPSGRTSDVPTDEYGVPLRDAQGCTLTADLREWLSRMSEENRAKKLSELDKGSTRYSRPRKNFGHRTGDPCCALFGSSLASITMYAEDTIC